ncbi:carbon-nitrogen hydrolase [Pyronema omphalodes]|nr:carbon-nitrogen hydrolase [Pyronema omphalodes]
MPITLALAQYPTQRTPAKTLDLLESVTRKAADQGVDLLLFPEAFLGGYPRTSSFGAAVGGRTEAGREEFYQYWLNAIDLGDVDQDGLGRYEAAGDGTREILENIAKETGVFIVTGIVEKAGATLFCAVLFVDPERGVVGKRRKVMPTGTERLCWGVGSQKTLKAIDVEIKGEQVTLGAAICWENYMPLLRTTLYSQGVNIYLAPTADARETWVATMQHIAMEGRAFVIGCNQYVTTTSLPHYVPGAKAVEVKEDEFSLGEGGEVVSGGGSVIFDPLGKCLAGPLWGEAGILKATIGSVVQETIRGKMDMDTAIGGHYARSDVFHFSVEGLDLQTRR